MKVLFSLFLAIFIFQSLNAQLTEVDSENEGENVVSKYQKFKTETRNETKIISEREAFNYREHLVDLTQFFPGFDYNNELTDDGAELLAAQSNGDSF